MKITDIIFDLDGTLVDSAPSILSTIKSVLDLNNMVPLIKIDEKLIGPPLYEIMEKISGEIDSRKLVKMTEDFIKIYDSTAIQETISFDGIEEQLERLFQLGYRLHIATNKRIKPTNILLERLGFAKFFHSVYAIDKFETRFENKTTMIKSLMCDANMMYQKTCYIGDRHEDLIAAKNNEIHFIYAKWSYSCEVLDVKNLISVDDPRYIIDAIAHPLC